ncbi:M28 family peptidase [Alphaproteobacteria bacterium KMM 3653]|uniref:Carboxypeptidase Q n=1 Tax=Harenicola maris TaxID=2841044 RepID=A0AAP2CPR2_9RHOB|nr:M28 family peptidase [Harenicola maris]
MDNPSAALRKEINLTAPWALVEKFAGQHREKPEDANRGAEMIAEALEAVGVPVTMHRPDLFLSLPGPASVEVEGMTFRAKPPAFCASVPEGIEAELIFVPEASGGTPLDRNPTGTSADVIGKIAVIEGFALPNFVAGLEAAGAAGVIAVNPGDMIHWGTVSTIWGTPEPDDLARLPRIPSAAINQPDGLKLIEIAKRGGRARLRTELETGWFPQNMPVVDIPGGDDSEEFVLLHGHYDSWLEGVGDNGTGNACMLEIARVLWANRDKLKRSVRLAWWAGHSTGRYGGSAWFADTFALDLAENCVAQMNCDSPGCRWATDYTNISCMSETEGLVQRAVADVTGQVAKRKRPQRNSDYSFNNIGISGCFMASSMMTDADRAEKGYYVVGGCGGNIAWHTETDTIEIADKDVLLKDIELYLDAVLKVANADVLPMDWRATAAEFSATIAGYQKAAGDRFDLGPATTAVQELSEKLDGFYAALDAGTLPAEAANAVLKLLARILVPINYTRGSRFTHDPALNVPPLPTIAEAAALDMVPAGKVGFALTQLMRGQNRLVAALREAARLVEAAL